MCEELEMVNYLIKVALFCLPARFLFGVLRIGFLEAPKILIFLDFPHVSWFTLEFP